MEFYLYHFRYTTWWMIFAHIIRFGSKLKGRWGKIAHTAYGYNYKGVKYIAQITKKNNFTVEPIDIFFSRRPRIRIYQETFKMKNKKKLLEFNEKHKNVQFSIKKSLFSYIDLKFLDKFLKKDKNVFEKYCSEVAIDAGKTGESQQFTKTYSPQLVLGAFKVLELDDLNRIISHEIEPDQLFVANLSQQEPEIIYDR